MRIQNLPYRSTSWTLFLLFQKEFGLCSQLPRLEFQQQTMDGIAEMLTRQLVHTEIKEPTTHFLIASKKSIKEYAVRHLTRKTHLLVLKDLSK
jgi:hypothetical protein